LPDFSGAQELDDRAHEHKFKVWLEAGQGTHEVTVAALPVQELPVQEDDGGLDLASIPAQRLATVVTKLRRAARGRTRQVIKEVRRKYRRPPRSRPDRNADFVKDGLCLIAVLMEEVPEPLLCPRLSNYWKRHAKLAHREFPDRAREIAKSLKE
ncbi:MAG: hypothetical protein QHJ34_16160, partial [bacterium]|nr:hypothetical protein [bacterium]